MRHSAGTLLYCIKPNTAHQHKRVIPTIAQWWRHDDLGSFPTTNTSVYQSTLESRESICVTVKAWPKLGHVAGQ